MPDFLQGQIRRMNKGGNIERQKGGYDKSEMDQAEINEMRNEQGFNMAFINDSYAKLLKSKISEHVYIENLKDRLYFTNSCWEVQRVRSLHGGYLILDDVYRLKHLGTGKYLALAEDKQELVLLGSTNSLLTLFVFKSDMSTRKT
jgi:hypothetical protein